MKNRLRDALSKLALAVLPLVFLYTAFEFAVFPHLLQSLPMRYHQHLPEPFQMLTRLSKKRTLPRDYVLVVGDSFAAGWGDWLRKVRTGKNQVHGSVGLMHQMTGIDMMSDGFPGASATEALARKPVNRFRYLRKTLFYRIEDPKHVFVYFYEGNDLVDDLNRIREGSYKDKIDLSRIRDERYFRQFIDTEVLKSDALYYDVKHFKWHYNYPSLHLLINTARNLFTDYRQGSPPPPQAKPGTNCFLTDAGSEVCIPRADALCPPVYLNDEELDLGLYIYGESLDYLMDFFPRAEFTLIYIPAPITSYPIVSKEVSIQKQNADDTFVAETAAVFAKSDEVFEKMRALGAERNIPIVDTRPALRRAAREKGELLHGPLDFYHFNQAGYEVMAEAVVQAMGWAKEKSR